MRFLLALCISLISCTIWPKDVCSHTFFVPRSLTYNAILELALSNYHFYHNALDYEHDPTAGVYVTPFYGTSRNAGSIARFFLPNTHQLVVKEDGSGQVGSGWIGVQCGEADPFASTISIAPDRNIVGVYCNVIIPLASYSPSLWASVSFAVMRASHDLHLVETINNSCDNQTATQAFNNPDWKFGKLSPSAQKRTGVDDIQIKLGYNWYWDDENHVGFYVLGGIPTGQKNSVEYMFGPVVGSKHGSAGVGFTLDVGGWVADEQFVNVMIDGHYRYLFSDKELRSFDLIRNGGWSRYLAVVSSESRDDPQPGINCFTQEVTVRPNSRVQLWTAIHYEVYKFNCEVGYNYWGRNKETICNLCFDQESGIWDIAADPQVNAISASKANISQAAFGPNQAPSDLTFVSIKAHDFNLCSAEHPRTSTHTLYGALSYNGEVDNCPGIIGIGASYEFARNNSALEQWMVWGKLGFVF